MATLPPCNSVLRLHILRSNMVAALWKRSMIANIEMPDITQHGWDVNGNINWVEEVFPRMLKIFCYTKNMKISMII